MSVIVGNSGEGKSTFLTHFAKGKIQTSWIVHLKLDELSFEGSEQWDHESVAKFIFKAAGFDSDNELQKFFFRHLLSDQVERPIQFVLDSFDEIHSGKDRSKALKLLSFLKNQTKCRMVVATSDPTAFSELAPSVFTFEKLNIHEKEKLLKQYWKSRYALTWGHKKCSEIFDKPEAKFKSFSNILMDQLGSKMEEKAGNLMGVPHQLRLLAHGFQDDFNLFIQTNGMKQKILEGFKLKSFYEHYINTKYDLYVTAKTQATSIDQKSKSFIRTFQNVSIDSLVPQQAKNLLNKSELFSSDYIIHQMTKNQSPPKVFAILIGYLLMDPRCGSLRAYLNKHEELLPKTAAFEISEENQREILGKPMITACIEGHEAILEFLVEVIKKKKDLKNVVLSNDERNQTALDYAFQNYCESCVKILVDFLMTHGDLKSLLECLERNQLFLKDLKNESLLNSLNEFKMNNSKLLNILL